MTNETPESAAVMREIAAEPGEQQLWTQFTEATTVKAFSANWLALQCRRVPGVLGGVVLTRSEGEHATYLPAAVWPDNGRNMTHLSAAAERALRERSGVLLPQMGAQGQPTSFHIAYPIEVSGDIYGVAVLEVGPQPEARLQEVLRSLHWGIAWLVDLFRQLRNEREEQLTKRVMSVLDTIAATVEANGFQHAATTFATEFSDRLGCDRVAVGFSKRGHAEVRAISHSAHFKQEANLVRAIGEAMDEALDQQAAIVYPELAASDQTVIARATRELAELHGADAVAIIPFHVAGVWRGAISLERCNGEPFSRADIELAQGTVALAGPLLESLRRNDLPLPQKAMESARAVADVFVGPKHLGWKLAGGTALALAVFFSIVDGDYRVTADVSTEGGVQNAIVAPFSGYVAEASVRAGDIVEQGQVVALLDDRDLQLERLKWASQRDQVGRQLREAKADREMAQIRILEAQLAQTEAQLALVAEQLNRTRIEAPYRGVIISGDLSQSLGAPVERGDVLFEVAPLTEYRLVLQVDDRDITEVAPAQQGKLTLSALPDQQFAFAIERVTPVATAEEGRNYFRVEARPLEVSERMRPGMQGVGKIDVGERKLIWIWTHRMTEWLRMWLWSWWP